MGPRRAGSPRVEAGHAGAKSLHRNLQRQFLDECLNENWFVGPLGAQVSTETVISGLFLGSETTGRQQVTGRPASSLLQCGQKMQSPPVEPANGRTELTTQENESALILLLPSCEVTEHRQGYTIIDGSNCNRQAVLNDHTGIQV